MLIQKYELDLIALSVSESLSKQIRKRGGDSDKGVTALIVNPKFSPAGFVQVITATPVHHFPQASLNDLVSIMSINKQPFFHEIRSLLAMFVND